MASVIRGSGASTLGGALDVQGVLTYEDVTSVDSVGIITARSGINVGTGASISSPDTNELALGTNNVERLRITSGGSVVVNRSAGALLADSSSKLEVFNSTENLILVSNSTAATGQDAGIMFAPSNNVYGGKIIVTSDEDFSTGANRTAHMAFYTRKDGTASEKLRIDSTGDVRFAGTNLTNNTNKSVNLTAPSYNTSEEDVNLVQVENESGMNQISFGGGTSALNAATTLRFLTASTVNTTTGTERLRITSAGDVGIGTVTPYNAAGYKSLTLDDTTGSQIRMRTAGADRGLIYNTDTELNIYTHNNIPINFTTGGRTQATLDYEGQFILNSQTATSYALWRKMSPIILAQYPDYSRPVIALSYRRTSGFVNASGFFGDVISFRGNSGAGHVPIFNRVCVSSAYTTNHRSSLGLGSATFRFVTFDWDGSSYQGIQYNTDASSNIMLDGWYATRGFKPFSLAASSVTSLAAANATGDGRLSSTSSSLV